jgi:hypothetical protein
MVRVGRRRGGIAAALYSYEASYRIVSHRIASMNHQNFAFITSSVSSLSLSSFLFLSITRYSHSNTFPQTFHSSIFHTPSSSPSHSLPSHSFLSTAQISLQTSSCSLNPALGTQTGLPLGNWYMVPAAAEGQKCRIVGSRAVRSICE